MTTTRRVNAGFVLLEVLVTIVVLAFGLLGLAGFQMRTSIAEQESYQRVQALLLVQDMVERVYANRSNAATYVQDDVGASGLVLTTCGAMSGKDKDICEWHNALVGASEALGGNSVGTLMQGRGCITQGAANEYVVTVVWQGLSPTEAPSSACGDGSYGNAALRRAVSMRVQISTLAAPAAP
jgi:type IV pilus assembly protein PilV